MPMVSLCSRKKVLRRLPMLRPSLLADATRSFLLSGSGLRQEEPPGFLQKGLQDVLAGSGGGSRATSCQLAGLHDEDV